VLALLPVGLQCQQWSAPRVDLPAGQLAAAHVDPQLAGMLSEAALSEFGEADRAALSAPIPPPGKALVTQPRRLVVDVAAPLAGDLELEVGRLQVGKDAWW
jgi:hypothetical protein